MGKIAINVNGTLKIATGIEPYTTIAQLKYALLLSVYPQISLQQTSNDFQFVHFCDGKKLEIPNQVDACKYLSQWTESTTDILSKVNFFIVETVKYNFASVKRINNWQRSSSSKSSELDRMITRLNELDELIAKKNSNIQSMENIIKRKYSIPSSSSVTSIDSDDTGFVSFPESKQNQNETLV
ncbi:hypothetical protein BpHYR1_021977 [Brachionus plicatilis]|uniref:Uncharacterized protein n=1 Tax=Brachionus plicatilis TaxID=10195 RepID=A0A3M7QMG5_BRAPC|nr:hypothetical protein BpHYR1_021977 [Brachionus plicatilis]